VQRSAQILTLLSSADHIAIIGAAIFWLPKHVGGERMLDQRAGEPPQIRYAVDGHHVGVEEDSCTWPATAARARCARATLRWCSCD
jgi:hypothetical protein